MISRNYLDEVALYLGRNRLTAKWQRRCQDLDNRIYAHDVSGVVGNMAEGLPEGLITNSDSITEEIERTDHIDIEDITRLWRGTE